MGMISPVDLLFGGYTEIVGIEECDDYLKAYVSARYKGIFFVVESAEDIAEVKRQWSNTGDRVFIETSKIEGKLFKDEKEEP